MHHRILGLSSTLAFLFVGYAVAWFSDPFSVSFVVGKPDAVKHAIEALMMASIFTFGVLFLLVWPQTLFVSWTMRRFRFHRTFPFAFFFGVSSIVVGILDFWAGDKNLLIAYLIGTGYLLVSCSILWLISFRHEPVA
jgi:hypothetical protein